MGTLTAKSIIDKTAKLLLDVPNIIWSRTELLDYLNDAQRVIVMIAPNSSNNVTTIKMVAGTLQSIPSDGWTLLDVYRNMGSTGTVPGRAVRIVSKEMMDAFNPDWHSDTGTTAVKNVIYDIQNQTQFWVYPPSDGIGYLQVNYAKMPTPCSVETDLIYVNDVLQTSIIDYMLYRAYSKPNEMGSKPDLAAAYWSAFTTALGAKDAAEKFNNPNQSLMPNRDPNTPGVQS